MKRLVIVALIALAVAMGSSALLAGKDTASAGPVHNRVSITCEQTITPSAPAWEGLVTCTINVDLPDPMQDITGTLRARYLDTNQNGRPNFGDRLICWELDIAGIHRGTCP